MITIGEDIPSGTCIEVNAHALARYAALCQEQGLVAIVEPEVLMDGDHDIQVCYEVTEAMLRSLFGALHDQGVLLEGTLLKASMVVPGQDCEERADIEEVAESTLMCLKSTVPAILPGIVFLSGGQSDADATAHLDAMNRLGNLPWPLSSLTAAPCSRPRWLTGPRTRSATSPRHRPSCWSVRRRTGWRRWGSGRGRARARGDEGRRICAEVAPGVAVEDGLCAVCSRWRGK